MKKIKLLLYIAFLFLYCSCSEEFSWKTEGDQFGAIYMVQAKEPIEISLSRTNQTQMVNFGVAYGGLNLPDQDIIITFKEAPELVTEYNNLYHTDYDILPSSAYSIESFTATIRKGTSTSNSLEGSFFVDEALLIDKEYLLPLSIASNSAELEVKKELSTIYYTVKMQYPSYEMNIIAGEKDVKDNTDGQGDNAKFNGPKGLALDKTGNLYVVDNGNHRIRKISPSGEVTTVAGSTQGHNDAQGVNARFNFPAGVAVNTDGTLYVVDQNNQLIRKITAGGMVSTLAGTRSSADFADGHGTNAKFKSPEDIAIDKSGNLFVADKNNQRIRKIDKDGNVTTLAGSTDGFNDGQGANAKFNFPSGVAVDEEGNVFVADRSNHLIRKVDKDGNVTTVAGTVGAAGSVDGPAATSKFNLPVRIALDAGGNLYITEDSNTATIRKIDTNGEVSTLEASIDGGGTTKTLFTKAFGLVVGDPSNSVYVSDFGSHTITRLFQPTPY